MNEYINLTLENIDEEYICCAILNKYISNVYLTYFIYFPRYLKEIYMTLFICIYYLICLLSSM